TGSDSRKSLSLTGAETVSIRGISGEIKPRMEFDCSITYPDGKEQTISLLCRLDTLNEVEYYQNEGILHNVLRNLI
ncbi:MAG: hypothetical protein MK137_10235, partial [Rickettsiales bacterium]|nr:hypothetical protein [Rickettsiales bacterium]